MCNILFSKKLKILLLFLLIIFIGSSFSFAETDVTNSGSSGNNNSSQGITPTGENSSTLLATGGDFKPSKLSQANILAASATVNSYVSKNGKLPTNVTISGYRYSMPEFLYLLSKTIQFKYKKNSVQVTPRYLVKDPVNPTGDSIKGRIYTKDYYNHAVSVAKYIVKYNKAPTYLNTKLGKMKYQTTIYSFAKILALNKANKKKLPAYLYLNIKKTHSLNKYLPKYSNVITNVPSNVTPTVQLSAGDNPLSTSAPNSLSQSLIWSASKSVKNYVETYGKLPNYVTISNKNYSMPEFLNLVSRAIVLKNSGSSSNVAIKSNIKNPLSPSGVSINKNIPKATFITLAKNIYNYIANNNQVPNYVSSSYGKIQYQTILYGFAKVGNYIGVNKKLPSALGLNIKSTSSLNNNIPNYSIPNIPDNGNGGVVNKNKNAIWLWSTHMKDINLNSLSSNGIGNIFLYESAFKEYGNNYTLSWINNASKLGVAVHIWVPCFYNTSTSTWINPIDTSTKSFNQNYFNTLITKISEYARMSGVAGIHLDYLRYPGTAHSFNYSTTVNGAAAITEFTRQVSLSIKSINPQLILSAAVMPETVSNAYYYGQDCSQLGKYLDVIVPMTYKGNYGKATSWITSTTEWFVKNSGNAKIWGGLQTYRSDKDVTRLSTSELATDSKAVLNGGAEGVALFRWGLVNLFNLLTL